MRSNAKEGRVETMSEGVVRILEEMVMPHAKKEKGEL